MDAINNVGTVPEEQALPASPQNLAQSPSPTMDAKVMYQSPPLTSLTKAQNGGPAKEIDKKMLDKLLDKMREQFKSHSTSLSFSIDEQTKSLVVKVIDSESEKVIRQIPPDEVLAIRRRIQEVLGALFDKEA